MRNHPDQKAALVSMEPLGDGWQSCTWRFIGCEHERTETMPPDKKPQAFRMLACRKCAMAEV